MSESSYPSDKQDKFMLRLPDGMRDRIKAAAEANSRSMNAEIVARLGASFEEGDEKFIAKVAAATLKALVENYPESTWDEMRSSISAATVGGRD